MIDLYYWSTPNGMKITIFLEEVGTLYRILPINIAKDEQFAPDFLKVSPNNKIPAIIDHSPLDKGPAISIFESGAILFYLAEKFKKFLPSDVRHRTLALQWLFWQTGGLGPMAGQNHHFSVHAPEVIPYAIKRYTKETARLYSVLNTQLSDKDYITGEYSIADMACFPWIASHEKQQQDLNHFPHIKRWFLSIQERSAVQRACNIQV